MPATYLVQINMDSLRRNLSQINRWNLTLQEVTEWLSSMNFVRTPRGWLADDRRKLLAFARDLLNSDYAGHRLTFQLFAQAPPFAHLAAVYRTFDWPSALELTQRCAGLSDRIWGSQTRPKAAE